jgi:radical SAM protein with 4Fe4S-binding SPASM domain
MIKNLRLIEIEIHSFCNRKCDWCPNKFIDRSFYKELDEKSFIKLLKELKKEKYAGYISLSRYNEPFSHKELLVRRISQIRRYLPYVKIVCNTNGDFDYHGINVDELTVMDYEGVKKDCLDRHFRIMKLTQINNRAVLLGSYGAAERQEPCSEPLFFAGIDYNGSVVPCCNIRSDAKQHKNYVLGNLENQSLTEILISRKAKNFREKVALMDFPDVCRFCTKKQGRYTKDEPGIA